MLSPAVEPELRPLLSFARGPDAVPEIADRLVRWLCLPAELRAETSAGLAAEAGRRFGWEGVADGVIAAAAGRLSGLPVPGAPTARSAPPSG
jgi:hypothetical protein